MNNPAFRIVETISETGGKGNEDAFGFKDHEGVFDLWVIDGATSIIDEEILDLDITDPAWFAQSLNNDIKHSAMPGEMPSEILAQVISCTAKTYHTMTEGRDIPDHAYPLAALVWMRAVLQDNSAMLSFIAMSDCRFLVSSDDGVFLFPQQQRADNVKPVTFVPPDAPRNKAGVLLSHLQGEMQHREKSQRDPTYGKLGLNSQSVAYARTLEMTVQGKFSVLAMSDGFYRLVDEYGLYDDAGLISAAQTKGLKTLYAELRAYEGEAQKRNDYAVKRRDDATAIFARIG